MSDDDLSAEENRAISGVIREELARRRLTRQHLADKAKISLSTIERRYRVSAPSPWLRWCALRRHLCCLCEKQNPQMA
jgi:hypothetical protein